MTQGLVAVVLGLAVDEELEENAVVVEMELGANQNVGEVWRQ